ncbi:MAG: ATP-binding cassette domain-containing protein [Rhodospirillales bacterium]|nr:ATP-binding cassette domain-containing protein [Rhodospirillales bacterium]
MTSAISACSTGSADSAPPHIVPRLALRGLRGAVVGPFDLTLDAGACIAIAGPSGAGKSLLLRAIADLDPNQGEVRLDGQDRTDFPAPVWRRRVIYCAAEAGWWEEDVAAHFPPATLADSRALAARLGLAAALFAAPVARLSSGERQRFALIRALVLAPAVLLLDEPTGPLDPDSTTRVEALLAGRRAAGLAILWVTHDAAQAARVAGRTLRLEAGRFVPP